MEMRLDWTGLSRRASVEIIADPCRLTIHPIYLGAGGRAVVDEVEAALARRDHE